MSSARGLPRLLLLVGLAVLGLLGLGESRALAGTLTLTPEVSLPTSAIGVSAVGLAVQPSTLVVFTHPQGPSCGATPAEERARPGAVQGRNASGLPETALAIGLFAARTEHVVAKGSHLVCGYVSNAGGLLDGVLTATASAGPVLLEPLQPVLVDSDADGIGDVLDPCLAEPGSLVHAGCLPDGDNDGHPDSTDSCPWMASKAADGCGPFTVSPWDAGERHEHRSRRGFKAALKAPPGKRASIQFTGYCFQDSDGKIGDSVPCTVHAALAFAPATARKLKLKNPSIDVETVVAKGEWIADRPSSDPTQPLGVTFYTWATDFKIRFSKAVTRRLGTLKHIAMIRTLHATGATAGERADRRTSRITFG
jgi:hypothetical protein